MSTPLKTGVFISSRPSDTSAQHSVIVAKNNPPACFLNAPTVLKEIKTNTTFYNTHLFGGCCFLSTPLKTGFLSPLALRTFPPLSGESIPNCAKEACNKNCPVPKLCSRKNARYFIPRATFLPYKKLPALITSNLCWFQVYPFGEAARFFLFKIKDYCLLAVCFPAQTVYHMIVFCGHFNLSYFINFGR